MNVLLSSAGRRVALLGCIRESLASRGFAGNVFTMDCGSSAPASFTGGHAALVPRCTEASFLSEVLRLCSDHRIGLIIPTIDTELPVYAAGSCTLQAAGTVAAVSGPDTVRICCDKVATHEWLTTHGFPSVRQTDPATALSEAWPLPLIAKPANGSASIGIKRIGDRRELEAVPENYIVQEIATGREFTINVYVSRGGECVCAVPHWRMEVRAGEVSKGITVRDARLIELGRSVAEALPGAYGPLNIQCFMRDSGAPRIIEMNARFGGGYPLAHRAGARFTEWLLDEVEGKQLSNFDGWTDDLAMLRYDDAVFVPGSRIRA